MNDSSLIVSELFYSIQGESSFAGLPCCFIRLSACNLRCEYCDSAYTWNETGREMTPNAIVDWLDQYPNVIVELTGGEPLLQNNIYQLFETLLFRGRTVLLETNGSLSISRVPAAVSTILDIKCPGSGMEAQMDWSNVKTLQTRRKKGSRDEIKFVLCSENDFHWARRIITTHNLTGVAQIIFSPVRTVFPADKLAALILEHQLPIRLQLQLHTILWPNTARGV